MEIWERQPLQDPGRFGTTGAISNPPTSRSYAIRCDDLQRRKVHLFSRKALEAFQALTPTRLSAWICASPLLKRRQGRFILYRHHIRRYPQFLFVRAFSSTCPWKFRTSCLIIYRMMPRSSLTCGSLRPPQFQKFTSVSKVLRLSAQ